MCLNFNHDMARFISYLVDQINRNPKLIYSGRLQKLVNQNGKPPPSPLYGVLFSDCYSFQWPWLINTLPGCRPGHRRNGVLPSLCARLGRECARSVTLQVHRVAGIAAKASHCLHDRLAGNDHLLSHHGQYENKNFAKHHLFHFRNACLCASHYHQHLFDDHTGQGGRWPLAIFFSWNIRGWGACWPDSCFLPSTEPLHCISNRLRSPCSMLLLSKFPRAPSFTRIISSEIITSDEIGVNKTGNSDQFGLLHPGWDRNHHSRLDTHLRSTCSCGKQIKCRAIYFHFLDFKHHLSICVWLHGWERQPQVQIAHAIAVGFRSIRHFACNYWQLRISNLYLFYLLWNSLSQLFPLLLSVASQFDIKFEGKQISNMMLSTTVSSGVFTTFTGVLMEGNINMFIYSLLFFSVLLFYCGKLIMQTLQKESLSPIQQPNSQEMSLLPKQ